MKTAYNKNLIYVIALIAATGGLLFGFDTGVISGAIPFFQKDFGIDDQTVELITASGLAGAMLGALFGGKLTDRLGRKIVILFAGFLFTVGAIWAGAAPDVGHLVASRLFLGIAIGISSFAVPLYLAEIAPAALRGRLVSLFQLMITIGVLASYLSDLYFADEQVLSCWRPMFYVGVAPALLLLVGMSFMPETPRWLMSRGRLEESRNILSKIEPPHTAEALFRQMESEQEADRPTTGGWRELSRPWLRMPLFIAIGIMFFQQFVGINTVIYYSPKIFLMAGFEGAVAAIGASVGVGIVNLLATLISVYFVDRLGRRKLFATGMTGIVFSLTALSCCFLFVGQLGETGKWLAIALVLLYVAFYAVSIGPLGWLMVSEVFPRHVRGLGTSIGSLAVWFFNTLVTFTFFKIVNAFSLPATRLTVEGEQSGNPAGAFFFYAVIAIVGLIWGYFYLPETKGVTLEEIEKHWKEKGRPRHLK